MFAKPFVRVALACACLSQAVRRDFKVDRPAGVVEGVSVLIQKHAAPAAVQSAMQILQKAKKAVQGITPGAKKAMDEALGNVIKDIEDTVQFKIVADHNETQIAIDKRLSSLKTATEAAVAEKQLADDADKSFLSCREEEKDKLGLYETAQSVFEEAKQNQTAPCAEQIASAPYKKEFAEDNLTFECDISIAGNCDSPLAIFKTRLDGLISGLETDVSDKTDIFKAAKGRCDAAVWAFGNATEAQSDAKKAFEDQEKVCEKRRQSRQVSMCLFGIDLAGKCASKAEFETLNNQIDIVNQTHSEVDRQAEWEATAVTKCMLKLIIDAKDLAKVKIDEASVTTCNGAVDFALDVGVLDRRVEEFADLNTAENFKCTETEISFSKYIWNVPVGQPGVAVKSEQYSKETSSVPVSETNPARFEFCAVDTKTCEDYDVGCTFGKVVKKNPCMLSTGCTASECCIPPPR